MNGTASADIDLMEAGKRRARISPRVRGSLWERLRNRIARMTWGTPLHAFRLRGRYPLKLLTVPEDPIRGDATRGREMLRGTLQWKGEFQDIAACTFQEEDWSPGFARYMQSFGWLRDLAALNNREAAAPVAEHLMRAWLIQHGDDVSDAAWRADVAGMRVLLWAAHAPLILSSPDVVYRSAVLSALARTARHLERASGRTSAGVSPVQGWCGVVAAGLLMPGGEARRQTGEAGLEAALATGVLSDTGLFCRSPERLVELINALAMLTKVYDSRGFVPEAFIVDALSRAGAALSRLTLGDGGLCSWQGNLPAPKADIDAVIRASVPQMPSGMPPLDWGYERLQQGDSILVMDVAPPSLAPALSAGCASTLAFELSDGPHRLIVNCGGAQAGGAAVPAALSQALRTTAAHSTLTLADSNSTALLPDGGLGKGVTEVEVLCLDAEAGSRIDATHDGYAKRFGLLHRRTLTLRPDGRDVRGEDVLVPTRGRKAPGVDFAVRFHLGLGVDTRMTADHSGALLRLPDGVLWQFRCHGGDLGIEDSIWIDAEGRMHATQQLVISGEVPAGGTSVSWVLRRAG